MDAVAIAVDVGSKITKGRENGVDAAPKKYSCLQRGT